MARAIFKSWVRDIDPVRAKAAGQQPPGLKPDSRRCSRMRLRFGTGGDSEGWRYVETRRLGRICSVGRTYKERIEGLTRSRLAWTWQHRT
jgi:hypothetical protein